jgi:hypothetical protein
MGAPSDLRVTRSARDAKSHGCDHPTARLIEVSPPTMSDYRESALEK